MSRSNPNEGRTPNPATRWFEWNGEKGVIRYYDKDAKQNVELGADFQFILLDQLGTVGGWHDASDSGIYANEVKDTRQEPLIVKAFKGGTLAEGIYQTIKDRVNAQGGQFVANCYIAFKNDTGALVLGSLKLKGAALQAWMEFSKAHRSELYSKAIRIKGFTEGKKGRIVFRVPVFTVADISAQTNSQALLLDQQLQDFLASYFQRTKRDQVDDHVDPPSHEDPADQPGYAGYDPVSEMTDDDIPFAWLLPLVLPFTGFVSAATLLV